MANTQINLYRGDTPPTDTTAMWFDSSAYVLTAPTGGSVTAGDGQITLHPGSVTGADSYNAYYTADGTAPTKSNGTKLTGVTDNQVVSSLSNGTLYKFAFTAIDMNGESAESAVVSATPASAGDTTAPTVTSFTIPATTDGLTVTISTFTATDAVGVTGYMVTESATPPSAGDTGWSGTAPTTYTASSNGSKTLYGYAKDAAGNVSTGVSATTTITTAPNAATGLAATNGNTESVITWTASATDSTHSAPTSYNLRWKLSTDGTYTTVTGVTSPYTKTGLTNGSTYNFIVDAINSAGTTSTSAVNATPAAAATNPVGDPSFETSTSLTAWPGIASATTGQWYKDITGTSPTAAIQSPPSEATPTDGSKALRIYGAGGSWDMANVSQKILASSLTGQTITFDYFIPSSTTSAYNTQSASTGTGLILVVSAYDASNTQIDKANYLTWAPIWGGPPTGDTPQTTALQQNVSKGAWHSIPAFDLKAFVVGALNTGKTWADVASVRLQIYDVANPSYNTLAIIDNFRLI